MQKNILHGILTGVFSGLGCYFFYYILKEEFMYDFTKIISPINIFGATMFSALLASIGHYFLLKFSAKFGDRIFNSLFGIFVLISLVFPMLHKLPLEFDEYLTVIFPTYAMTMHFIPFLFWFMLKPFFFKDEK